MHHSSNYEGQQIINGRVLMNALAFLKYEASEDELFRNFVNSTGHPHELVKKELKRILHYGVSNGFLAKNGNKYLLPSLDNIYQLDAGSPSRPGFVRDTIAKDKVVIFSMTRCPYCVMAKKEFQKLNVPFFSVELENRDDSEQIIADLSKITGIRTVPQVFIDGKFIGGGTDVKKLNESGKLKNMLGHYHFFISIDAYFFKF